MGLNSILDLVRTVAMAKDYSEADIAAGIEYASRKTRRTHPPGRFDSAGRFHLSEPFRVLVRSPSRAHPYSEMMHATTTGHVAYLYGADELATKRIAKVAEKAWEAEVQGLSDHQALLLVAELGKGLKAAP